MTINNILAFVFIYYILAPMMIEILTETETFARKKILNIKIYFFP